MRLVSESKLFKLFLSKGVDFDTAHILSMEAVTILLNDEELPIDLVVSQLVKREMVKAAAHPISSVSSLPMVNS